MGNLPALIDNQNLRIVACPHPFRLAHEEHSVVPGKSLWEILLEIQPDISAYRAHVWVDNDYVPPDLWHSTYPIPGSEITIRVVPQGGAGRIIGMIFIAIAAIAVSILTAGALSPIIGAGLAKVVGAVAGMIVGMAGTMIMNALIPPVKSSGGGLAAISAVPGQLDYGKTSPTYSISGMQNRENLYGPVPKVFGVHKEAPPIGARTYTESSGNDQYLHILVVWGFSLLEISDLRIKETPIANYQNVEMEHRNLIYDGITYGDEAFTLYPDTIEEEALSIELRCGVENVHTSELETDKLSVDVTCMSLIKYNADGSTSDKFVEFTISYRATGSGDPYLNAGTINLTGNTKSSVRGNLQWVPEAGRGQYDIKIVRVTTDDDVWNNSVSYWTSLRSIKNEDPVSNFPHPLAMTAMRIKASGQLDGTVDELTATVSAHIPDWDDSAATWTTRITQNPASAFLEAVQGMQVAEPLADARIDWDSIQEWHEYCETEGWEYNKIVDYQCSIKELLDEIASSGRAAFSWIDSKLGVIIDQQQAFTIGPHFTPRNILKGSHMGTMVYPDLPHAWRAKFINEEVGYQQDERIVLDDGYQVDGLDAWGNSHPEYTLATLFEELEFPGVTNPDLVFRHARYHIAVARLRPETTQFKVDIEWLVPTRGDRIKFAHDTMLVGLSWGRVTGLIYEEGTGYIAGVYVDEELPMQDGTSYCLRFRLSDNTSLLCPIETDPGDYDDEPIYGEAIYGEAYFAAIVYARSGIFLTPINPSDPHPAVGDLFLFGECGEEAIDLIVKSIQPTADLNATFVCISYDEAIYAADQGVIPPFTSRLTIPAEWWTPVIAWVRSDGTVLARDADGSWQSRILVTLTIPSGLDSNIVGVECQYRVNGSDMAWKVLPVANIGSAEVSILPVEDGVEYEFKLRYVKKDGSRGKWGSITTETVEGKTAPPSDVTGFYVYQTKEMITCRWSAVADLDLAGYEIRYVEVGGDWDDGTVVNGTFSGTTFTTSEIPTSVWDIMIKAIDTTGNYSDTEDRVTFDVYSFYDIISGIEQWPLWPGTRQGYFRNPRTGNLNPTGDISPDSSGGPSSSAGRITDYFEIFSSYVPNPISESSYTTPEIDLDADTEARAWARMYSNIGGDESGSNSPDLSFDYRLDGGAYDGFEDWTIGYFEGRYAKFKMTVDNDLGALRITGFQPVIDAEAA